MNKDQIKQLKAIIEENEKDYSFNDYVFNYIDEQELKDIEDEDDLKTYLEDLNEDHEITNAEVIYYSNAIEYLKENDPSLNECLEIADEYGYTMDKLNSELLASLLMTRNNEEDYYQFLENTLNEISVIFEVE